MKARPVLTVIHCERPVPIGAVFFYGYRPLRVVRVCGDDAAAPVICEELVWFNPSSPGQLCLWSVDGVRRAMRDHGRPPSQSELDRAAREVRA